MRFVVPVAGAALISAFAADARAVATSSGCQIVLLPQDADPRWQQAVSELRTLFRERSGGDVDCGEIEVQTGGPETSIRFTTRDGRRAERPVAAPAALLAVVEALATTVPEPSSPSPGASPPVTVVSKIEPDKVSRTAAQEPASTAAEATARFLFGASAGMRVASAASTTFGSLSFGLGVGVNVGHWEVGVLGEYDPAQISLPGSAPGLSMSTYVVGLRAGRRDRVGPLDAAYGLSTAIVLTNEMRDNGSNQQGGQGSLSEMAEPRAGIFAGIVVPRHAKLRLRPELGFDVIASRIGNPWSRIDAQLPAPWWSTSASLGLEWEAP